MVVRIIGVDFAKSRWLQQNWLWWLINLLCTLWAIRTLNLILAAPLHLGLLYFTTDELQYLVLTTGYNALLLLSLSLACTPLAALSGWNRVRGVRKSLGLWGFGFATLHTLIFLGGTRFWIESEAWKTISYFALDAWSIDRWGKVPFAWAGAIAFSLLIPLALTSNRWSMRLLGKNWKRLHRLVYLALPFAIWHYGWREFHTAVMDAQPADYRQVVIFAGAIALLLLLRLPWVLSAVRKALLKIR